MRNLIAFTIGFATYFFWKRPLTQKFSMPGPMGKAAAEFTAGGTRLFLTRSHSNQPLTLPRLQTDRERSKSDCSIEKGRKRRSTPSTSAASNLPCGGKGPKTRDFSSVDRSKRPGQIVGHSPGLLGGP